MEQFIQVDQVQHDLEGETQNAYIAWNMRKNKDKYYVADLKANHEISWRCFFYNMGCNSYLIVVL